MIDAPLVSIVIPSFNQGRFIDETIRSCLSQDYRPLEVIVMDGGSTDETIDILKGHFESGLIWRSEPDDGVVDAVNKALRLARGEIIAIQSSDDIYLPGAVGAAVDALSSDPDLALVYGDVELIDAGGVLLGADLQGEFDLAKYVSRSIYVPQPAAFFRASAYEKIGGWRQAFSYVADADFWLRMAYQFPVRKFDRIIGRYRYHDEQRDKQTRRIAKDWRAMIDDHVERQLLPRVLQRQAYMGVNLADHRYLPESAWIARTCAAYRALAAYPPGIFEAHFPGADLLPGRWPVMNGLSRAKRAMGFSPRRG